MEILHVILGVIVAIVCFELVKHLLFRKTSRRFMLFLLLLIFFLRFSYVFKDVGSFQDNKFVQTGAVISGEIIKIFEERLGAEQIINSTLKSNKLFKS